MLHEFIINKNELVNRVGHGLKNMFIRKNYRLIYKCRNTTIKDQILRLTKKEFNEYLDDFPKCDIERFKDGAVVINW